MTIFIQLQYIHIQKNLLKLASFLEDNFNLQIKFFLSDSKVFIDSFIKKIPVINLDSHIIKFKKLI